MENETEMQNEQAAFDLAQTDGDTGFSIPEPDAGDGATGGGAQDGSASNDLGSTETSADTGGAQQAQPDNQQSNAVEVDNGQQPDGETDSPAWLSDFGQGLGEHTLSTQDWVIGLAVVVVLAVAFLVVRRAFVSSLTGNYADYEKAKNAGTMLYMLLLISGAAIAFAALGNLWTVPAYLVSAGVLFLIFAILFAVTYLSARR